MASKRRERKIEKHLKAGKELVKDGDEEEAKEHFQKVLQLIGYYDQ